MVPKDARESQPLTRESAVDPMPEHLLNKMPHSNDDIPSELLTDGINIDSQELSHPQGSEEPLPIILQEGDEIEQANFHSMMEKQLWEGNLPAKIDYKIPSPQNFQKVRLQKGLHLSVKMKCAR